MLFREGHYLQVRLAAFEALFFTKWYSPIIMRYILTVMANDPSRIVRRQVARWACQSLPLFHAMGDLKDPIKKSKSLLVEEDGANQENKKEPKKADDMHRALRKNEELGKNEVFRKFVLPIIMFVFGLLCIQGIRATNLCLRASDADLDVRWSVLKLADLLVKGADEVAPSITIHLPPTPAVETPPQLPPVKVTKPQRSLSIRAPVAPAKSPLTPFTVPPKLKLPLNGTRDSGARAPASATPLGENRRGSNAFPVPPVPPRKASTKQQPKAQAKAQPKQQPSGMARDELIACQNALRKLKTHKNAPIFLQPVDPVRDGAPKCVVRASPADISY